VSQSIFKYLVQTLKGKNTRLGRTQVITAYMTQFPTFGLGNEWKRGRKGVSEIANMNTGLLPDTREPSERKKKNRE